MHGNLKEKRRRKILLLFWIGISHEYRKYSLYAIVKQFENRNIIVLQKKRHENVGAGAREFENKRRKTLDTLIIEVFHMNTV